MVKQRQVRAWWNSPLRDRKRFNTTSSADFDGYEIDDSIWTDKARYNSGLDSLWSKSRFDWGWAAKGLSEDDLRIVEAYRTLQAMADTMTRRDGRHYKVIADQSSRDAFAYTDLDTRKIVVSPAPLFDKSLSDVEARRIMTGALVHEIGHDQYGRSTHKAVSIKWPGNKLAATLSNLLDDVRDESRTAQEWPGLAGVFKPLLDYVAKTGDYPHQPSPVPGTIDFAIAAVRYAGDVVWSAGTETARDSWQQWAREGAQEDSPSRHVKWIERGLAMLQQQQQQQEEQRPGQQRQGQQQQNSASDSDSGTPGGGVEQKSEGGQQQQDSASPPEQRDSGAFHACASQSVGSGKGDKDTAATTQGVLNDTDGKEIAGSWAVFVAPKSRLIPNVDRAASLSSDGAGAIVRQAILRSRTGREAPVSHKKSGRLDQHAFHRLLDGRVDVFKQRRAESIGRIRVLVLVDKSGSMTGNPSVQSTKVVKALAEATRGIHSVQMEVVIWSDHLPLNGSCPSSDAIVCPVWKTGEPIADLDWVAKANGVSTPDIQSLTWGWRRLVKQLKRGERGLLVMATDGIGDGKSEVVAEEVAKARKAGLTVVGVALGNGVHHGKKFEIMYGNDRVDWRGSVIATAKPLADWMVKLAGKGLL